MENIFTRLKYKYHHMMQDARGGVLIIAAIATPVLVLATGMAVDMARVHEVQKKLSDATDTAALSSAAVLEKQDVQQVADRFFRANFPEGYMNTTILPNGKGKGLLDISVGKEASGTNNKLTLTAHVAAELDLVFGSFLGMQTYKIEHTAKVERVVKPNVEIVLTVDVSPSMCALKVNNPNSPLRLAPDPNCTKLNAMKSAMRQFVNLVFDNSAIDTVKIGIIPYNHKVQFLDSKKIPPTVAAGEKNAVSFYSNLADATPLPAIVPLTTDRATLIDAIDAIDLDITARGWTRPNLGTHVAALMLDPLHNSYFSGEMPLEFDDEKVEKIIVQMTDGAANGCCFGAVNGDFSKQYMYIYKTDMDAQQEMCEVLKKPVEDNGGNVTLFSVVFDVDDTDYADNDSQNIDGIERTGGKWIKETFNKCASNKQFYFDVAADGSGSGSTEDEIEKVYTSIAQYLYKLRIVY
jgi:Flp pilus assembly protein TadG